ncbi:hypothetical protein ACFL2Q_01165 [Thermodesulfobacteriota bacterium]
MDKRQVQSVVTVLIVTAHIALLFLIYRASLDFGFSPEQAIPVAGMVIAMFGAYSATIVAYWMANPGKATGKGQPVNFPFLFISCGVPAALLFGLFYLTYHVAYVPKSLTYKEYAGFFSGLETMFAVYLGPVVRVLFEVGTTQTSAPVTPAHPAASPGQVTGDQTLTADDSSTSGDV